MKEAREKCDCKEEKKPAVVGAERKLNETKPVVDVKPVIDVNHIVAVKPAPKPDHKPDHKSDHKPKHKPEHKHRHYDDSCSDNKSKSNRGVSKSDEHDNRNNSRKNKNAHRKHKNSKSPKHFSKWGKNEATNAKIDAKSKAQSYGNGNSASFAGPQGAKSQASGSKGTSTGSSFNSDEKRRQYNWGETRNGKNKNAWGQIAESDQKVASKVHAKTFGKGASGTATGRDGAEAFGKGTKGSKTGANWKGNLDNKENSFGITKTH